MGKSLGTGGAIGSADNENTTSSVFGSELGIANTRHEHKEMSNRSTVSHARDGEGNYMNQNERGIYNKAILNEGSGYAKKNAKVNSHSGNNEGNVQIEGDLGGAGKSKFQAI